MNRHSRTIALVTLALALLPLIAPAASAGDVPEWVKPALRYMVDHNYLERDAFKANKPMPRSDFKRLMKDVFGGGYSKTGGDVKAKEVDAALVKVLNRKPVAKHLSGVTSPDGWDPRVGMTFGYEIVARELGLRHDRGTSEERFEASAGDAMTQADVIWSVWQADTSPDLWSADALKSFELRDLNSTQRKVVKFAFSVVGTPYIWGGEWDRVTPAGYPYGAQPAGGVDCSGFTWFVLHKEASNWHPAGRDYSGWNLPERSSSDMAAGAPKKIKYKNLRTGDAMFFASRGRDAKASEVYHVGVYLGRGWMIHSSGSRDGVSLARVSKGSWWHDEFTWGRRVIKD